MTIQQKDELLRDLYEVALNCEPAYEILLEAGYEKHLPGLRSCAEYRERVLTKCEEFRPMSTCPLGRWYRPAPPGSDVVSTLAAMSTEDRRSALDLIRYNGVFCTECGYKYIPPSTSCSCNNDGHLN